jgi:hypothetical protein
MKTITATVILLLGSQALLQARGMESLRASSSLKAESVSPRKAAAAGGEIESLRVSSEKMNVDVSTLRRRAAADRRELKPAPVPALLLAVVNFLKLLFAPNGDIEISNPSLEAPQVDDILTDDEEEEVYVEGQAYEPLDPAELPAQPFAPSPQPAVYQPQQQDIQSAPRADAGGGSIPQDLKRKALEYFNANAGRIKNKRYIGVVDFSAHSSKDRFWILDLQNGAEHAMHVAHGAGSDPDADGFATRFRNVPNSRASSLGFYVTGELYRGKHGRSMRLHGLSSTNSNALSRAVVMHESNYVREANVRQGRSFGCLALAPTEIGNALASLRGGALIYAGLSNSEF